MKLADLGKKFDYDWESGQNSGVGLKKGKISAQVMPKRKWVYATARRVYRSLELTRAGCSAST